MSEILRDKGGFLSPAIRRVDHQGRPAVMKDYGGKNVLTRTIVAPALVRREFAILRRLEGVPGIPRALAVRPGPALIVEFVEGRHIHKFKPGELPDETFRRLEETVRRMHGRDVVHLDLRQRKNIIIGERPYLLDFANAVHVRAGSPLRPLFARLRTVDESGLLKFKARHWPHLLTPDDRETLRRHRLWRGLWFLSPHKDRAKDKVW